MTDSSGPDGVQTPPSLVSTPRAPPPASADHTPATLGEAAARLAAADPSRPPIAHMMHDLWLAARHSRRDAVGVHAALRAVAARVAELQAALAAAASDMDRLERAAEIRLMEKECEIKMAQSEAAAHAMAAQARAATAAALQASVAALQEEKERGGAALAAAAAELEATSAALSAAEAALEASNRRAGEHEAAAQALREELDALRTRVPEGAAVEAARRDAAAAAGQLVDACEENARLAEEVATLEGALLRRDADVAALRAELEAARARGPGREPAPAPAPLQATPGSAFSRGSRASSSPRPAPLALALPAAADPEDLLAVEVCRLRGHTEELEAQLAEARGAAPLLQAMEAEAAALRGDNVALRAAAERAAAEAGQAQAELHQVQAEARALHGQLAEVISSLASGGPAAAEGPAGLLPAQPLPLPAPRASETAASTPAEPGAHLSSLAAAAAVRGERRKGLAAALPAGGGGNNPSFPPTPTWGALPAPGPPRPGSHGGDGPGELILAELRTAMAHLKDSGSALAASSGSGTAGSGPQADSPALPSANGAGASSVLDSISRGIAALGGDRAEPADSGGASSVAPAATVTPRVEAGGSTASTT